MALSFGLSILPHAPRLAIIRLETADQQVLPPSTTRVWPVVQAPAREAR